MKKVLFIAAAAAIFFSCQKEQEVVPATPSTGFSFEAAIEDLAAPTKADMNSDYELVWAAGDEIGIYVNDSGWTDKNQPFVLSGNGGSTNGKFDWAYGDFTNENATVAFFPWQGLGSGFHNVYEGTMYFKMPQTYEDYTSGKMLTPLVAPLQFENGKYSTIEFKHAGAAIKVTVNNLPAGISKFSTSVEGQQIHGGFKIDPAQAGEVAMVPEPEGASTDLCQVWLNFEPSDAEREFTFIVPVPELTTPKLTFVMEDENGVTAWAKNLKAQASDLKRGEVLEMPAIDITPYQKLVLSDEWTVMGTCNGTSWDKDFAMMTDGTMCVAKGLVFEAGGEFKVRYGKEWDTAYPSSNWVVNDAGTYDILFDSYTKEIKVVPSKCAYPDANAEVTLYFGIGTTDYTSILFCSPSMGTDAWPGTELTESEVIMGTTFFKYTVEASKVWGKTFDDLYIYGMASSNWATAASTGVFAAGKTEYYFDVATKYDAFSQLDARPAPPAPVAITMDGDMSDWANCQPVSVGSDNYKEFRATYDENNIYVYTKRTTVDGQRYIYYDFDLDNDSTTGVAEGSRTGLEAYMALVLYSGNSIVEEPGADAYSPDASVYAGVVCKGIVGAEFTETEVSIPRSNLSIQNGDVIKIYSWGNKSAAGVSSHPITLYIEN